MNSIEFVVCCGKEERELRSVLATKEQRQKEGAAKHKGKCVERIQHGKDKGIQADRRP